MNSHNCSKNWYLVQTKSRNEQVAIENLSRQGYECYLPKYMTSKKLRGKCYEVCEPLFAGYIFILLDCFTDNWSPVRSTKGVQCIVRFGGEPALVKTELVEMLRNNDDERGIQILPKKEFCKGQDVTVSTGPLAGYHAIYDCASSSDRAIVLLTILNQDVRLQLSELDLEMA